MKALFLSIIATFGFLLTPIFTHTEAQTPHCAQILDIQASISPVALEQPFQCTVTVDQASAGSTTIACGISINNGPSLNFCPSDTNFGGWDQNIKNKAKFNCKIPPAEALLQGQIIQLIAYDFQDGCGQTTGIQKTIRMVPLTADQVENIKNPYGPQAEITEILQRNPNISLPAGQGQSTLPIAHPPAVFPPVVSSSSLLPPAPIYYSSNLVNQVNSCLHNQAIYQSASTYTGLPWQVFAGIHYREGSCNPNKSLVSGRPIASIEPDVGKNCSSQYTGIGIPVPISNGCGFYTLLDSAVYAGRHLAGKIGHNPKTYIELVTASSRYNGGGNSNCGRTPYASCPRQFEGEDDTYVLNLFDQRHTPMYIVYCADYTLCNPPIIDQRPGTITASELIMQ